MKKLYLVLSIIGFIVPTIFVIIESIETSNYLLYTHPMATFEGMYANRISTIFSIDLLFTVMVFFIWSYNESKKHNIKSPYIVWLLTMTLGLAEGFPLFLYLREKSKIK